MRSGTVRPQSHQEVGNVLVVWHSHHEVAGV